MPAHKPEVRARHLGATWACEPPMSARGIPLGQASAVKAPPMEAHSSCSARVPTCSIPLHSISEVASVASSPTDTLGRLLLELCVRRPTSHGARPAAVSSLPQFAAFVRGEARDLTGEALSRFISELYSRIGQMINRCFCRARGGW